MAMLADLVDVARRGRHPQAHPDRRGRGRRDRRHGQPGDRASHSGADTSQLLALANQQPRRRVWAIEAPAATAPA
jgi:hypothetical protein